MDPRTLHQALNGPYAKEWKEALELELANLWGRGTFEKIDILPPNAKVITGKSKLLFKMVLNPDNTLKKFKVRLVARGDQQRWDTYNETYAGTAKRKSVMLLLNLATALGYHVHTADITAAFLYPELNEELYLEMPSELNGRKVYVRLRKALYGLKQAAYEFMQHLRSTLVSNGFTPTINDPYVYVKRVNNVPVYIATYVDDLLITSPSLDLIREFEAYIGSIYEVTINEVPRAYLGMDITYAQGKSMSINSLASPLVIADCL